MSRGRHRISRLGSQASSPASSRACAKTEGDVRNRLLDRDGESPEAAKPDIIERTGTAPPGVPPPSATRTADLTEPRPQGGVFDSRASTTMPGEVRSPGGTPTRVRDKAGGPDPATSNDIHGAPSGAVFDSAKPSGRRVETKPASAAAAGEGGAGPGVFVKVSESMSAAAAAYQARVTGSKAGTAYRVNGVKFDGFGNGVLIDAKGRYASLSKMANSDGGFAESMASSSKRSGNALRRTARPLSGGLPRRQQQTPPGHGLRSRKSLALISSTFHKRGLE